MLPIPKPTRWLVGIWFVVNSYALAQTTHRTIIAERTAADPHLAVFDGHYYLYPSTYGPNRSDNSQFEVWTSTDLTHWQAGPTVLNFKEGAPWARSRAWAPAIARRNGQYYFYFSADDRIGVATGSSPTGPFRDPLGGPLVPYQADLSTIDPMAFIDDDGQAYLFWGAVPGSWRTKEADTIHTALFARRLRPDMVSFDGPVVATVATPFKGPHIEGSFVFKRRGVYYLLYSEGNWDATDEAVAYRVRYATARYPLGPYTKAAGPPVLVTDKPAGIFGPGHNSVINQPGTDEWFICYHYHRGDADRRVALSRLTFTADGALVPVVLK